MVLDWRTRRWAVRLAVLLAAVPAVLLAGCGSETPSAGPQVDTLSTGLVRVVNPASSPAPLEGRETLRLGTLDAGPAEFGRIADLAVSPDGKRLYVLDSQSSEIRVFDMQGEHIRTFGREGAGPGELRAPGGLVFGPDGRLRVVDLGNARYSFFTPDGEPAGTLGRQVLGRLDGCCVFDAEGRFIDAGVGLGADRVTYRALFRIDHDGNALDTLALPQVPFDNAYFDLDLPFVIRVPYYPSHEWTFDPRGRIWTTFGAEYRLVQRTLAGDSLRVVVREGVEAPTVPAAERSRLEARLDSVGGHAIRSQLDRIPARKPFIRALFTDLAGRIWAQRFPADETTSLFDVFDPTGAFLGAVTLPEALRRPVLIRGSDIYGTVLNDGVPRVVRYQVDGFGPRG